MRCCKDSRLMWRRNKLCSAANYGGRFQAMTNRVQSDLKMGTSVGVRPFAHPYKSTRLHNAAMCLRIPIQIPDPRNETRAWSTCGIVS